MRNCRSFCCGFEFENLGRFCSGNKPVCAFRYNTLTAGRLMKILIRSTVTHPRQRRDWKNKNLS